MTAFARMMRVYNNALVRHPVKYYGNSGFLNFGYWDRQTRSQGEASQALVDLLIDRIAVKGGRILDVACGVGASTRRLMRSYAPNTITAVDISELHLIEARKNAPECSFMRMDAARLEFPDDCFDAVICVEAAFHFDTREAFLREALRVLKPGGSLVLSDILFRTVAAPLAGIFHVPRANLRPNIASYRKELESIGYDAINIQDATEVCVRRFCKHLSAWAASQYHAANIKLSRAMRRSISYGALAAYIDLICKFYILVACRKPSQPSS